MLLDNRKKFHPSGGFGDLLNCFFFPGLALLTRLWRPRLCGFEQHVPIQHGSLLRNSEAPCRCLPVDLVLPPIPGAQPCALDGFPAVLSHVITPTACGVEIAAFHDRCPIWYAGHVERLPICIQKQVCQHNVGDIAGSRKTPIIFNRFWRQTGVG